MGRWSMSCEKTNWPVGMAVSPDVDEYREGSINRRRAVLIDAR